MEERKHVIEEEEHGGGKKDAAGAHPGGKAAHLENADMVSHQQGIRQGRPIFMRSVNAAAARFKCTILERSGACSDGMHVLLRDPPHDRIDRHISIGRVRSEEYAAASQDRPV